MDNSTPAERVHAAKVAALEPERVGSVAMGARREFTAKVRELVAGAGDSVREQFASDEVVADYVATVHRGIKTGDRTSLRLYAEIMKLVGEERRITVEFIHSLGARSEEELKRYVDAAKSVEGAGPHDGAERCVAYLEAYLNVYPEQRAAAVKRLGGYAPVGG